MPEKFNIWVALMRTIAPYQDVLMMTVSPAEFTLVFDEYDNQYAEFDMADIQPGETRTIEIRYSIVLYDIQTDMSSCKGALLEDFTQPELYIESNNPQIIELAETLSANKDTVCDQVRSFYDHIGNTLTYTYNNRSWGAQATFGDMGADCTEFASLLIALSRAEKIPARYLEGVLYLENKSENANKVEHAWVDVWLPGNGWSPMDPTLGRSSITRNDYFGKIPSDHFIVTVGKNPSTLRGSNYYTYMYWPGKSTTIKVSDYNWQITPGNP